MNAAANGKSLDEEYWLAEVSCESEDRLHVHTAGADLKVRPTCDRIGLKPNATIECSAAQPAAAGVSRSDADSVAWERLSRRSP